MQWRLDRVSGDLRSVRICNQATASVTRAAAPCNGGGQSPERTALWIEIPVNSEINREFCGFEASRPPDDAHSQAFYVISAEIEHGIFLDRTGNNGTEIHDWTAEINPFSRRKSVKSDDTTDEKPREAWKLTNGNMENPASINFCEPESLHGDSGGMPFIASSARSSDLIQHITVRPTTSKPCIFRSA
jgi:hypothetical protein